MRKPHRSTGVRWGWKAARGPLSGSESAAHGPAIASLDASTPQPRWADAARSRTRHPQGSQSAAALRMRQAQVPARARRRIPCSSDVRHSWSLPTGMGPQACCPGPPTWCVLQGGSDHGLDCRVKLLKLSAHGFFGLVAGVLKVLGLGLDYVPLELLDE